MRIQFLVFSKDRPLQLDGALRSLRATCARPDLVDVTALWKASNELLAQQYATVAQENSWARFVAEESFREDVIRLASGADLLGFVVDDVIFLRTWDPCEIAEFLQDPRVLGVSLRLGRNTTFCYAQGRPQRFPSPVAEAGGYLVFRWPEADADFGYPLELSSSVYRASDVAPLLQSLSYHHPNTLEDVLSRTARPVFAHARPILVSPVTTIAVSVPANRVQDVAPNKCGEAAHLAPEALAERFRIGERIDVAALAGFVPNACHQELELPTLRPELAPGNGPATGSSTRPAPAGAPRVSVVVRCFKQAQYLPEAVGSVVSQTFSDWEAVIVDDGSPDDTAEVADELIHRHGGRVRLVRQANAGLSGALNAGVRAARGEYILPLDADDLIEATYLEKAVALLDADRDIDIVYADGVEFGERTGALRCRPTFDAGLGVQNGLNYCSMYRKSVWERVGGYNLNMVHGYEDWDFWVACVQRGIRARHLEEPLFRYRVRSGTMMSRAIQHHAQLHARIVLNSPAVFDEATVERARLILQEDPLQPCTVERGSPATMPAQPLVSIVIPCFAQAAFLPQAVCSVVSQTHGAREIVVVDDGSPDDVEGVVRALAERYPREEFLVVRQPNQGLASARNAGISAARGKYILPLDADDHIDPSFLSKTVSALEADPGASIAFTDVFRFGAESALWRMGPWDPDLLRRRNVAVCTALFRKSVWTAVGGYNENMVLGYEDYDFWLGCAAQGARAVHVQEPLFFYRVKSGSMVSGALRHHAQLHARAVLNHPGFFPDHVVAEAARLLAARPLPATRSSAA